jgi:predicted component of type VI protein secretion system
MQRRPFDCIPNKAATHKLHLQFEAVDTEEIKGLNISFDGSQGIFKIGEGDANHYQIPNDKKLWESQLMIVCKDGKYYVRDLGIVHTSRIKIDKNTEVQIQQDMLVDLGKVVHYHFNKVTHKQQPTVSPSQNFQVLFSNGQYACEEEDSSEPPALRARPTWVSSDENKDLIQKEIILEAYSQNYFSIGRSMKREVQIKLKAVSADHCNVSYDNSKGWSISEKGKDKLSSNGTFVFMKSHVQMTEHEPSDLIPLHDGMVLSFINYEIRVNLEKKDGEQLSKESQEISVANATLTEAAASFKNTLKANVDEVVTHEAKDDKMSHSESNHVVAAEPEPVVEKQDSV